MSTSIVHEPNRPTSLVELGLGCKGGRVNTYPKVLCHPHGDNLQQLLPVWPLLQFRAFVAVLRPWQNILLYLFDSPSFHDGVPVLTNQLLSGGSVDKKYTRLERVGLGTNSHEESRRPRQRPHNFGRSPSCKTKHHPYTNNPHKSATHQTTTTMERVTLFEDIFEISALNPDGYKFDHVNRLQGTGPTFGCELLLDINSDIYNVRILDRVSLVLAST